MTTQIKKLATVFGAAAIMLTACGKKGSSTDPGPGPDPTPPATTAGISDATEVVFENNVSGMPTTIYFKNTNASGAAQSVGTYDQFSGTGVYKFEYRGLNGRAVNLGTPRAGTSNLVTTDAPVGDTMVVSAPNSAGVLTEIKKFVFKNDAANVLNGGISTERMGSETNIQAISRLTGFVGPSGQMKNTVYKVN